MAYRQRTTMAECIECGASLSLYDDLEKGEILDCGTCGAELEVLAVDPVEVETAPELQQDWGE